MLSCKEVSHQASSYLDRNLPWRTRLAVAMHLLICVHCRRYMRQLALTIRTIGHLGKKDEPDQAQINRLSSELIRHCHDHDHPGQG